MVKINSNNQSLFPDVFGDEWYAEAIKKVVELGLMKGDTEGTFRPNEPVTRAELAYVILNLFEKVK
jgi:hypothetical protein